MLMACAGTMASANHKCQKEEWKKKLQSEKIAFLSTEIGLTPEEAQAFWPVYNETEAEKDLAMHEVFKAFRELEKAIEEGRSEKEIGTLLDKYIKAQETQRDTENKATEKYRKVLPADKVAKLLIGEENFRRHHIRKLHGKPEDNQAKR